jgi:hypothetical protein
VLPGVISDIDFYGPLRGDHRGNRSKVGLGAG